MGPRSQALPRRGWRQHLRHRQERHGEPYGAGDRGSDRSSHRERRSQRGGRHGKAGERGGEPGGHLGGGSHHLDEPEIVPSRLRLLRLLDRAAARISKSTNSSRIVPSVIQGTAANTAGAKKSSSYPSFKLSRVFKQVQTCRFLHFVASNLFQVLSKVHNLELSNYDSTGRRCFCYKI